MNPNIIYLLHENTVVSLKNNDNKIKEKKDKKIISI
jgi:hypothetical protein